MSKCKVCGKVFSVYNEPNLDHCSDECKDEKNIKKYKCIKGFLVDLVDGDGFTVEEDGFEVNEGTIWEVDENNSRIICGQIRLVDEAGKWMEMCEETLAKFFIGVK